MTWRLCRNHSVEELRCRVPSIQNVCHAYGSEEVNMKTVLFFFVACVLLISASQVFGQEAQAPIYKEGECWVFRSASKNFQGYVSGVLAMPGNGDHKICFLEGGFFE